MRPLAFLGFAGSLRKGSYNRALLSAAGEMLPNGVSLEVFGLEGIPPFNMDLEATMPARVQEFKAKIKAADAIVIATPEHNYSIPGVLKNAIDWASRPHGDNSFEGKPAAIMSASTGLFGGSRAQYHLRQVLVFLNMYPLNRPELFVMLADKKVDSAGKVTDEETRKRIGQSLEALAAWTLKLRPELA